MDDRFDNKQYYWEPTASACRNNPIEVIDVSYFFEDGSSLSVFGPSFLNCGMGNKICGTDYGKDWKISLPTAIGAKWISFAEKKAYIIYEELPVDQLKVLFDNGYQSYDKRGNPEHGDYETLDLCLMPGGIVVLYVKGAKRKVLLNWSALGEHSNNYELFYQEGNYSKTLDEYINNTIKHNDDLNVPELVTSEIIKKYLDRFNYKVKIEFEDIRNVVKRTAYEYSNAEFSIVYDRNEDSSIKYPSRMKYFVISWIGIEYKYRAYFYFNEEEVIRVFDEAYGDDRKQDGVLTIFISKYNNLFEISLSVNEKKYVLEKTEIRTFRIPLSNLSQESELFYKNYDGDHKNIFVGE